MIISIKKNHTTNIQILRGLSVVGVVIYHAYPSLLKSGFLGVDIFFVISGYLITPQILAAVSNDLDLRQLNFPAVRIFYKRRFWRIFPTLFVVLLLTFLTTFLVSPITSHKSIARQGFLSALGLGNLGAYLFNGNYFTAAPTSLLHTWSLGVEEQIYLALPIILVIYLLFLKKITIKYFVEGLTLISFIIAVFFIPVNDTFLIRFLEDPISANFYSPITRFWEFGVGAVAASVHAKRPNFLPKSSLPLFYTLVFLITGGLYLDISPRLLTVAIVLLTFCFLVFTESTKNNLPFFRTLSRVGDRSYSIYLVHLPLLCFIDFYSRPEDRTAWHWIAILGALCLISELIFVNIENRFRYSYLGSIHQVPITIAGLLIATLASASLFTFSDTFGSKLDVANEKTPPYDWDKKCHFLIHENSDPMEFCLYGSVGSPKLVYLIGDSYAASLSKPLVEIATKLDFRIKILTHSNCYFTTLIGETHHVDSNQELDCARYNRFILNQAKKEKPHLIIYSMKSIVLYQKDFRKLNLDIFSSLHDLSKSKILVIGSPPPKQNSTVLNKLFPKSFINPDYNRANSSSQRLATKFTIDFFNLKTILCQSKSCDDSLNGHPLYFDFGHISNWAAAYVRPNLESKIISILEMHTP